MTRVNLVDPEILTDQHLVAERLELNHVVYSASRSLNSKTGLKTSNKFTLNAGHVTFFHDKLEYIRKRHRLLTEEMIKRGMNPQHPLRDSSQFPAYMQNDYVPCEEDLDIIKERIEIRIRAKPSWYKFHGVSIGDGEEFIQRFYTRNIS